VSRARPFPAYPYLDWPGPIPFAHRGGALENAENTMRAFEHAFGLGYRYFETDVQLTRDGVLIVFHDDTLDRVTDRRGRIAALPWAEVQKARVDGTEPIPRFDELLEAWPEVRVNVEPKVEPTVEPLVAAIRRAGAWDRVCVGAFDDARVTRVQRLAGPRLCTAIGRKAAARLRLASLGIPVGPTPAPCAQVPTHYKDRFPIVDRRFVRAAHRRGVAVHVWTIDDAGEMRRLLDLGVDGIMTDRPTVLRTVLEERDQWVET
jgi:glycerophosphoryl diester phosphodiesterase